MKKIGEGYYYNVYEINKDKVIKKTKSKIRMYIFILITNYFYFKNYKNFKEEYNSALENLKFLPEKYKNILNLVKDKSILGNPEFIDDLDYYQDKYISLRDINKYEAEKFERIVLNFTKLLHKLWSYRLSDSVFNFSLNCGVDKNDNVILFDFNEMDFDKDIVTKRVKDKVWLKRSSYFRLSKDKKEIFKKIMDQEINLENLDKYWKDN